MYRNKKYQSHYIPFCYCCFFTTTVYYILSLRILCICFSLKALCLCSFSFFQFSTMDDLVRQSQLGRDMTHANPLWVLRIADAQDTLFVRGRDVGAFALTTIGTATVVILQLCCQFLCVRHVVPEKQIIGRRRPLLVWEEQDFEIALRTQQRVADTRRKRGRAVSP